MTIDILYQDEHLLILNKPNNTTVQESAKNKGSLEVSARHYFQNDIISAVHRIDFGVSGIVVLAKTKEAAQAMGIVFRNKNVKKEYIAVVKGKLNKESGELINFLVHEDRYASVHDEFVINSKLSKLNYRVVKKGRRSSMVNIELQTGRFHQIRAQFAHIGHPIIGDDKYDGPHMPDMPRNMALHAYKLEFIHPFTNENLIILAQVPNWWNDKWGNIILR